MVDVRKDFVPASELSKTKVNAVKLDVDVYSMLRALRNATYRTQKKIVVAGLKTLEKLAQEAASMIEVYDTALTQLERDEDIVVEVNFRDNKTIIYKNLAATIFKSREISYEDAKLLKQLAETTVLYELKIMLTDELADEVIKLRERIQQQYMYKNKTETSFNFDEEFKNLIDKVIRLYKIDKAKAIELAVMIVYATITKENLETFRELLAEITENTMHYSHVITFVNLAKH